MIIKPSKSFEGSALPPAETSTSSFATFTSYLDTLNWAAGNRDASGWKAFLRAGSLNIDPDKAVKEVAARTESNGGTVDRSKLQSQLRRAYDYIGNGTAGATTTPIQSSKAVFAPEKLKAFALKVSGVDISWLKAHSPVSPTSLNSAEFLQYLYEPGEMILLFTNFKSQGQHLHVVGATPSESTRLPDRSPEGVWFLVNPVDGNYHANPRHENKPSRRSEESITSWRYMVLESDIAEQDQWLACLVQLPLRIAAVYTSGGKSIHALVRLDAESKKDWDQQRDAMKPILVTLGADEAALTAVRLSRLPATMRGDRLQELLYLNLLPTCTPIISLIHKNERSS